MSTDTVILKTVDLSRSVGEAHLVQHISVEIEAGDVVAIVGPSGSGKSSLLRLLNRLDEPTGGTVILQGTDYREIAPQDLRQQVGMVMQAPFLFPGSVADNLRFGPKQRGEDLSPDAIEELLTRVNLAGYASRGISNLSGGEAQRVSLARTLANSPSILLLDEPTSALDDKTVQDVERLICEIIHYGALTALIVTHDQDQARRMAHKAMSLEAGRLVAYGPVKEVLGA